MESQKNKADEKMNALSLYKYANRFLTYIYYVGGGFVFGVLIGFGTKYNVFLSMIACLTLGLLLAKLEIKFTEQRKNDFERMAFIGVIILTSVIVTLFLFMAEGN